MNEALAVYGNLNLENVVENKKFIRRIDELLLTVGMKYSDIRKSIIRKQSSCPMRS